MTPPTWQKENVLFHPELSFPTYLKVAALRTCDFGSELVVGELRYVPAVFPASSRFPTDSITLKPPWTLFHAIGFL